VVTSDFRGALSSRSVIGTVVKGRWRIESRLGEGGSGTVYAAADDDGGRVAIKVLHKELAADRTMRTRFLREGYAANEIQHDGVVRVIDADVLEDGMPFQAMELLDGESLEERALRLGGRRLPVEEVLPITVHLLDVLAAAHALGIVHRDVKPDNVFLIRRGGLKVLDFGLARMKVRRESLRIEATSDGLILGTLDFMSPEQARGENPTIDPRADLWSVGATAFTMLSGERVHSGKSVTDYVTATGYEKARSLFVAAPDVPRPVIDVIDRALSLDKCDRFASAAEMQDALRAAHPAAAAPLPPFR